MFIEIPLMESTEYKLCVISGKIKNRADGETLSLSAGLNKLSFTMLEDGSFELQNAFNDETIYPDTIGTKYFI